VLKIIIARSWVAAAFVAVAIPYGASTEGANAQMPRSRQRAAPQAVVCASLTDVYNVASKDMHSKEGADFSQLLREGKCALVPAKLIELYWYFDEYKDASGTPGYIAEVAYAGYPRHLFAIAAALPKLVEVTYKNEHANNPPAVSAWFREAHVKGACDPSSRAWLELQICGCCEFADRLHTKFVGEKGKEWLYYPATDCTTKGCPLVPIPNWVTHEDGIHALGGYDDTLPAFNQMRREGVLFIYRDKPSCFWPPEDSDG
jgi:hypothetical protein